MQSAVNRNSEVGGTIVGTFCRNPRCNGQSRGFHSQNSRSKADCDPAGRQRRIHFFLGKTPLGTDRGNDRVEDLPFAAMLQVAPSGLPPGWARIRKVFVAKLSIACCQFCGSVISSSRLRPHCLLASITFRLNRSNEAADVSATLRFVLSGTIRVTPNSTAFSTSHRWRSPFGSATANVKRNCRFAIYFLPIQYHQFNLRPTELLHPSR